MIHKGILLLGGALAFAPWAAYAGTCIGPCPDGGPVDGSYTLSNATCGPDPASQESPDFAFSRIVFHNQLGVYFSDSGYNDGCQSDTSFDASYGSSSGVILTPQDVRCSSNCLTYECESGTMQGTYTGTYGLSSGTLTLTFPQSCYNYDQGQYDDLTFIVTNTGS